MPTNPPSLQARLDAMVRQQALNDCQFEECEDRRHPYAVALDLLRQLEERDERIQELETALHRIIQGDWFRSDIVSIARAALKGGQP